MTTAYNRVVFVSRYPLSRLWVYKTRTTHAAYANTTIKATLLYYTTIEILSSSAIYPTTTHE